MGGKGSGRRRKPTELKVLHGSFIKNPQRMNEHEPETPADKPVCPKWFDDVAKAEWKFIVGKLEQMKLQTSVDRPLLEQYCQYYSQWRKVTDHLNQHGQIEFVSGENGASYTQIAAEFRVQQQLAQAMAKILVQFGFSPSSRAGLFVERNATKQTGGAVVTRQRG